MTPKPNAWKVLVLITSLALAGACVAYAATRNGGARAPSLPNNANTQAKPALPAEPPADPAMGHAPSQTAAPNPAPEPTPPPHDDVYLGGSKSMPMPRYEAPSK